MLHDADIRVLLFDYLDLKYGKVRTFEEKEIGRSRSDVVAVTDNSVIGFEIKSDADTYTRLKSQVRDYDKFYDLNYVVVGRSHEKHSSEHVRPHWGILAVTQTDDVFALKEVRAALPNPKLKPDFQMKMMWKSELFHILALNGMPKYREKSRKFICEKILAKVPSDKLKQQMCAELFERDYTVFENTPLRTRRK